jgi:hypothetical protein
LKAIFRPIEVRCNEIRLPLTGVGKQSSADRPEAPELVAWPSSGRTSAVIACRI